MNTKYVNNIPFLVYFILFIGCANNNKNQNMMSQSSDDVINYCKIVNNRASISDMKNVKDRENYFTDVVNLTRNKSIDNFCITITHNNYKETYKIDSILSMKSYGIECFIYPFFFLGNAKIPL